MTIKTIENEELRELTWEEWGRIHASLRRRFKDFDKENVQNIGIGPKQASRKSKDELLSVRFLVRNKRTPRAKKDRIAKTIEVRLKSKRHGRMVRVVIPSDVEEVKKVIPTGVFAKENNSQSVTGTLGLLVKARKTSDGPFRRGVITVGHPYVNLTGDIRVTGNGRGTGSEKVSGVIKLRSSLSSLFDSAFFEARRVDFMRANYYISDGGARSVLLESELSQLANDGIEGTIRRPPPKGPAIVKLTDYIHQTIRPLPIFGHMRGLIRGTAKRDGVFFVGSSGSVWRVNNEIAGIQFAAEEGLRHGYAQSAFVTISEWLEPALGGSDVQIWNSF